MEQFLKYLRDTKESLVKNSYSSIHVVLGNESCDMDSCISSLAMAYYLHNNRISGIACNALVVPVQNVSKEQFLYRTDNVFVLKQLNIPLDSLIYRDDVDFNHLSCTKTLTVTLVDHHVLSTKDAILKEKVTIIFDHRPVDPMTKYNDKVFINVQQVGSCCTLVAQELFKKEGFVFRDLAWMLYEVIVYDTVGLLPENGRAKDLDIQIANTLEEKFGFKEDRRTVYQRLWKAHNDVSHLTPKQMLSKDMKVIDGVPVPGLPMLVTDFLKLDNSYESLKKFAEESQASLVVLIGLDATNEVRRDIGIFYKPESASLKDILLNKLQNAEQLKGYDFSFTQVGTNFKDIVCLKQANIKLTRKQIVPLLIDAIKEVK